ncbi:MAG TPA: nuclear transport factor 2 family protein [bacterium]|nr:nuclear transport factor 2 family protein [bacterium]
MTNRTNDYDEITRVMQLYIDGFNDHDINKFKQAFDENAWIFYVDAEGTLIKYLIAERLEEWAALTKWREEYGPVVGRIMSVTQVGDAASVQTSFDRSPDASRDGSTSTACFGSTASGRSPTRPPHTAAASSRLATVP